MRYLSSLFLASLLPAAALSAPFQPFVGGGITATHVTVTLFDESCSATLVPLVLNTGGQWTFDKTLIGPYAELKLFNVGSEFYVGGFVAYDFGNIQPSIHAGVSIGGTLHGGPGIAFKIDENWSINTSIRFHTKNNQDIVNQRTDFYVGCRYSF